MITNSFFLTIFKKNLLETMILIFLSIKRFLFLSFSMKVWRPLPSVLEWELGNCTYFIRADNFCMFVVFHLKAWLSFITFKTTIHNRLNNKINEIVNPPFFFFYHACSKSCLKMDLMKMHLKVNLNWSCCIAYLDLKNKFCCCYFF